MKEIIRYDVKVSDEEVGACVISIFGSSEPDFVFSEYPIQNASDVKDLVVWAYNQGLRAGLGAKL